MKNKLLGILAVGLLAGPMAANASIIWNWSFAGEAGQFITDGTTAVAGTYTLSEFIVTSSGAGGTLGSLSGGTYETGVNAFSTTQPFSFVWDGSQVTQWLHSGLNSFDWWAFHDTVDTNQYYFFGWDTGNINDPTRAALYDQSLGVFNPLTVGDVSVAALVSVPEPSTLMLLGVGLAGLGFARRRKMV